MMKFKVGDRVQRKSEWMDEPWDFYCKYNEKEVDSIFIIQFIDHNLLRLNNNMGSWKYSKFNLAIIDKPIDYSEI